MAKWGYGTCDGPQMWTKDFPAAAGSHQSPINIVSNNTVLDSELTKNKLKCTINSDKLLQKLHFTGHNFKVETSTDSMTVTGIPGHKSDQFKLVQYHFHWSNKENEDGSEHQVNGKGWPAELHLVHYNSTKYANFCEAVDKPDGLAVLGVFFEVGKESEDIEHLMKCLADIETTKCVDLCAQNSSLNLRNLLPKNMDRYYTYSGSLTTPPCYESVTWVVFEHALSMSKDQMSQFRKVHNDGCETHENYRPVCPLNDRKVKRSFK